jgi:hypothetical protein
MSPAKARFRGSVAARWLSRRTRSAVLAGDDRRLIAAVATDFGIQLHLVERGRAASGQCPWFAPRG